MMRRKRILDSKMRAGGLAFFQVKGHYVLDRRGDDFHYRKSPTAPLPSSVIVLRRISLTSYSVRILCGGYHDGIIGCLLLRRHTGRREWIRRGFDMKRIHGRKLGVVSVGALALLVFLIFSISVTYDSKLNVEPLDDRSYQLFERGWTVYMDDVLVASDATLPLQLTVPSRGVPIRIVNTLPDPLPVSNSCIAISLAMSTLDVSIDGRPVYSFNADDSPWKLPFLGGAMPHFVRVPEWGAGKEISLEMSSTATPRMARVVSAPALGTKISTMFWQLDSEWLSLFFGYTFFFIGVACLAASPWIKKIADRKSLLWFGVCELFLGIWVLMEGKSKFLFFRNPAVPIDLYVLVLYLAPMCLAEFFTSAYQPGRAAVVFRRISALFVCGYCVVGALQFSGRLLFSDTMPVVGFLLGLYLLAMFVVSSVLLAKGNKGLLSFILALAILFLSAFLEVALFVSGVVLDSVTWLHVSLSLCGLILFVQVFRNITSSNRDLIRERMLLEMAYTDALTGFGNRAAYDQKQLELDRSHRGAIGILAMDMNDLKSANDTQGHLFGDKLLHEFAMNLKSLLPESALAYRIGGDEFIVFVEGCDASELAKLVDRIVSNFAPGAGSGYSVAVGSSLFVPSEGDIVSSIRAADRDMYACKAKMKGDASSIR